ncbi:glyoxalase/bleomycin resistance protein/dioxygenase [Arthrobacter crystallopoietes BAB-32]|uniref:Glyoxalase/bleomycin resistance protein/dioxygenase n=1 Tax=Arthrobacter crystallopoietes BAB-32 TaxID=1246476 RepID=N1UWH1_9MICC|nr:VOC family protein [Arthrobacter crystallopoietes]EMY32177.1 glyoxalase/bleomycin resistance protein/dioxygenase [Arthrobacter crystallopoietes BAB-32]
MAGRVVHFEIPADDQNRARDFYQAAFGWDISAVPDMDYNMVLTSPVNDQGMPTEPGSINGGMFAREGDLATPVVTVEVDDIDAALEQIGTLGGSTVIAKQAVLDMGFAAYFRDTEGNILGLWENKK